MTYIVKRHANLNSVGHKILDFTQSNKIVFGLDIFRIRNVHSGNEATKRLGQR